MLSEGKITPISNNAANQAKVKAAIEAGIKRSLSKSIGLTGEKKGEWTSISEIIKTIGGTSVDEVSYPVIDFINKRATKIRQQVITNLAADPKKVDWYDSYKNASTDGDDAIMSRWIQQCYKDSDKRYTDDCVVNSIAPPNKNVTPQTGGKTTDRAALDEYRKWLLGVYKHPQAQEYVYSLTDGQLTGLLADCGKDPKCVELKTGFTEDHRTAGDETGGKTGGSNGNYADNGGTVIPGSPNVVIVKHRREAWN